MKRLEKKLRELEKQGYETITIAQVLQWISNFKRLKSDRRAFKETTK